MSKNYVPAKTGRSASQPLIKKPGCIFAAHMQTQQSLQEPSTDHLELVSPVSPMSDEFGLATARPSTHVILAKDVEEKTDHLSTKPADFLVPVVTFCKAFPFHFLCDRHLALLQIGSGKCALRAPSFQDIFLEPVALGKRGSAACESRQARGAALANLY